MHVGHIETQFYRSQFVRHKIMSFSVISAFSFIQIRWLWKDTFINFHDRRNDESNKFLEREVVYPVPSIYAGYLQKRRDPHTVRATSLYSRVVLWTTIFLAKIQCIVLWVKIKNIRMNWYKNLYNFFINFSFILYTQFLRPLNYLFYIIFY